MIRVGIVGAGLIGKKRAFALPSSAHLVAVCDANEAAALSLIKETKTNAKLFLNWKDLISDKNIDVVIIATPHCFLAEIARETIKNNKHVFIEKPGAINIKEFSEVIEDLGNKHLIVQVGYNHRYHPAISKAKKIIDSNKFGKLLFIRAKYGHGGRLGYEKEWRFKKKISGGGQLVDQGSHLIDLVNFFAGEFNFKTAQLKTNFWKTELEDTAFLMLEKDGQLASLSTSCIEWKNLFQFEIFLERAKLQIDGLGRSYGTETLTVYKMKPKMGPPNVKVYQFEGEDQSFTLETRDFFRRIKNKDYSKKSLNRAKYVLEIISNAYEKKNK